MRRNSRQISLKECYEILGIEKNADMDAVKRAYRKRAFELHPDLNPDNPDASRNFQTLNEAYVLLSGVLEHEKNLYKNAAAKRAAEEAARESKKEESPKQESSQEKTDDAPAGEQADAAQEGLAGAATGPQDTGAAKQARAAYAEHDVLRDLLNDPFARRVFEDIYSELNKQQGTQKADPPPQQEKPARPNKREDKKEDKKPAPPRKPAGSGPKTAKEEAKGVGGVVKGWLRRQIDEEQSLTLPAANLSPGKRIRLQIRQAFSGELKTVEITLPPDFAVGKPIRLRGLGKRVGPWQGDLYLTISNE